jgi:hypothetical protein
VGRAILVVHVFDQEAFSIPLSRVVAFRAAVQAAPGQLIGLQLGSGIFFKRQRYDRSDAQGAAEEKDVFIVTPAAARRVGTVQDVTVASRVLLSASKKYVAHVLFSGGRLDFEQDFLLGLSKLTADPHGS